MEEAKNFLRQVRTIELKVINKKKELVNLKELYFAGDTSSKDKIKEYEEELKKDIDNLIDKKCEVKNVIDKIDNADMVDILYKRYFGFEKWEQIAAEKNYTYQAIHKIHAKSLQKVKELIKVDSF